MPVGFFSFLGGGKGKGPRTDLKKRFELLGRTGQGSMSKVWRARDKQIGRTVCLKIMDKEKTARFDARFPGLVKPSEGAILTCLRHPNIVQTFDHGVSLEGEQFLVMELIEGHGLNFFIETQSPYLNGRRIDILAQLTDGVQYIHDQKYLHRDICPRNTMITQEGVVKIIDYGLTIPYTRDFCKPGNRTGTPNYLAPELIKRTTTDHRVDLFALGVTAYETITGRLPWEKAQSMETLLSHMNREGKDPREFQPDLDERMVALLVRAIRRDPNERFQTAAALRDALKALPKQDY
jgi:serine/threonine protein kinase